MSPSRRSFLLGGAAAAVLVACGDDGDDTAATTTAPQATPEVSVSVGSSTIVPETTNGLDGELPPVTAAELEPLFGEPLAALGLVLTDRGGLIDTREGRYVQSPNGNHLALYAEPAGEYTDDQFIDGILDVTLITAPEIFRRWPALESFDVCQEPRATDDPRPEPLPATQIAMTAEQVQATDWATVTLVDLLAGSLAQPRRVDHLVVSTVLQENDRYQQLLAEAEALANG